VPEEWTPLLLFEPYSKGAEARRRGREEPPQRRGGARLRRPGPASTTRTAWTTYPRTVLLSSQFWPMWSKTDSRSTAHWSIHIIRPNGWLRHSFALLITLLDIDGIGQNWKDSNKTAHRLWIDRGASRARPSALGRPSLQGRGKLAAPAAPACSVPSAVMPEIFLAGVLWVVFCGFDPIRPANRKKTHNVGRPHKAFPQENLTRTAYSQYPVIYHPCAHCSPCSSDAFLWRTVLGRRASSLPRPRSGLETSPIARFSVTNWLGVHGRSRRECFNYGFDCT